MSEQNRLEALNNRFIEIYEATRSTLVGAQKKRALIVVDGEEMLFFLGGREPETITGLRPPLYTELKILAHVPLAIFSLLTVEAGAGSLSDRTLSEAGEYLDRLRSCAADLAMRDENDTAAGTVTICERSLAFLETVLERRCVSEADLDAFAAGMGAEVQRLFASAARVQLDRVHEHVMRLKKTVLSPDEWRDLRVVVMGPHMAHKEDLFLQYFSRVLHTPMYTEKRLVYFEGDDRDAALDLVGTTLIDSRSSRAFFRDETRMHRDVLSDATRRYLRELLSDGDGIRGATPE